MKAILIAAPGSGAGKTSVTLGLLRSLRNLGHSVRSVKLGPDYIDTGLHAAASGKTALNLDGWAMAEAAQTDILQGRGPLVVEAAMGLFDGAGINGTGSAAEVAIRFDLPVILVLDCARQSHTAAAIAAGLSRFDPALRVHGVILNNVGSARHQAMLRVACDRAGVDVLAALPRRNAISHPSRHLGLVQANERSDQEAWLTELATWLGSACTPEDLLASWSAPAPTLYRARPPAQRIAIAKDTSFSFSYQHLLNFWKNSGADIQTFSPLNDDHVPDADLIILPGGYPELYAGRLASNQIFIKSLKKASEHSDIYGECGGYMTLGDGLIDAEGHRHAMAGLLRLETSFEKRALHLGYRRLIATDGPFAGTWKGHEFHHSTELLAQGTPLFEAWDADGTSLQAMGLRAGRVSGSYAHLIAPSDGIDI